MCVSVRQIHIAVHMCASNVLPSFTNHHYQISPFNLTVFSSLDKKVFDWSFFHFIDGICNVELFAYFD